MLAYQEARAECDLSELVGYKLVAQKTISGYIEDGKRSDDFEGCDFDRIIVFSDNTVCAASGTIILIPSCRTHTFSPTV
jgi:hypothetical protein